jgi:hypothetical protein
MAEAQRPILLIPAKLKAKTLLDFKELQKVWDGCPPAIQTYEWLGRRQASAWLASHRPDLIIADEAHRLKNVRAAVTRRVGRYMQQCPRTKFVALSGTMTERSIMDFAHILEWCLKDGSPVPLYRYELEQWAQVLDERSQWDTHPHPGAILEIEEGAEEQGDPTERARRIYHRRLTQTLGVVASKKRSVSASLIISQWDIPASPGIQNALTHLRDAWELPDGHPLILAVDMWRHEREIALGFWYRWRTPPPHEWLTARQAWASYARQILSRSRKLDSESQVAEAHSTSPEWARWVSIRDTYTPETIEVWITLDVLRAAVLWAQKHTGIVWVEHQVVGRQLDAMGLPYYGEMGLRDGQPIEMCRTSCCASIRANSEGRNLQRFAYNLVLSPPTTGSRWEQMLGRTHREGQRADEVDVEVYLGCHAMRRGFRQALKDAEYQRSVLGSEQKLQLADILIEGYA